MCKFAIGRVAGKDGKQHGAPHFRGEIARMKKPVKTGATYKSLTKMHFNFAYGRYVVNNKRLVHGGGGGS